MRAFFRAGVFCAVSLVVAALSHPFGFAADNTLRTDHDDGAVIQLGKEAAKGDAASLAKLRTLAQQRMQAAQHTLGNLYEEGTGVPKDAAQAAAWYRKAAGQADSSAWANENLRLLESPARPVPPLSQDAAAGTAIRRVLEGTLPQLNETSPKP